MDTAANAKMTETYIELQKKSKENKISKQDNDRQPTLHSELHDTNLEVLPVHRQKM